MEKRQLLYFGTVILITFILFFQASGLSSISQEESSMTFQTLEIEDVTYYSDTSDAANLTNCVIPDGTKKITLDPRGSENNYYNFSDWNDDSNNRAYTYNILYTHRYWR